MGDDAYRVALRRVAPEDVKKLELSPIDDATLAGASAILRHVRTGGEAALLETARKYGDIKEGAFAAHASEGRSVADHLVRLRHTALICRREVFA
jgi:hypothetical protein